MTLTAWRIVKTKYAAHAFDGEGARLNGGRWTSVGRRAVYTSSTVALATLELLAHLGSTRPLAAYSLFEVTIPGSVVTTVDITALPKNWRTYPAPRALCAVGDAWLDGLQSAALRVPSAIVGVEVNFVINPAHQDFSLIKIGPKRPYDLDPRLVRKSLEDP